MTDGSNKDFNPKHRVIGAIVLVAVAVIILPLILDRGDAEWQLEEDATAAANQVFVADLARLDVSTAVPAADPPPAVKPTIAPAPATSAAAAADVPASRREPARAVAAGKGYYVQVGTFGNQANARQLADKLERLGYAVRLEPAHLPSGDALRVRVGPYAKSDQAEAARAAIRRKLDVQGIVRAY